MHFNSWSVFISKVKIIYKFSSIIRVLAPYNMLTAIVKKAKQKQTHELFANKNNWLDTSW